MNKLSVLTILFIMVFLAGCANRPNVRANSIVKYDHNIQTDNSILIRKIKFNGAFKSRNRDIYEPLVAGFSQIGEQIKSTRQEKYAEGFLDLTINTQYSSTGLTKAKYVPIFGGMLYSYTGGVLDFKWEGSVVFVLSDLQGNIVLRDSFELTGKSSMESKGGFFSSMGSYIAGGGAARAMYEGSDDFHNIGSKLLETAGAEIAKRLRKEPARSYLIAMTKERDGMDPITYAEFKEKKKRLKAQRAEIKRAAEENLNATVKEQDSYYDLESSSVVIFGVGVDHYRHFPDLKYAASDSKRFVDFFKERYNLSADQAMLLENEDATAIKVTRFLERNAFRLLDKDDTFIFYFSGHGAPEVDPSSSDADGLRKYLLLHDSEPDALPLTAISLDDLAELLRKLPSKRVLMFIDSCFAGVAGRDTLSRLKGIRISERSYKNMTTISGKGRVILAASTENQASQETELLKAGVFTHYLLKGLDMQADANLNHKIDILELYNIDILELYNYVRDKVEVHTNGNQTPVFRGALDKNIEF